MGKPKQSLTAAANVDAAATHTRSVSARAGINVPSYKVEKVFRRACPDHRQSKHVALYVAAALEYLLGNLLVRGQELAGRKADGAPKGIKSVHLHLAGQDSTQVYHNLLRTNVAGIHRVLGAADAADAAEAADGESAEAE